MRMFNPGTTVKVLATAWFALATMAAQAQLPELVPAATVTGAETSARFFAGATADEGATYGTSFGYDEPIDILTEIQVEAGHVNTMGNLYVIIVWNDVYFMRDENGAYQVWDLNVANPLDTLQAAFPGKTLQSSEPITIVDNVAFGPAGVSDTSFSLFLAYDTMAASDEVFFSGAPLTISIGAEQTQASSLELYQDTVSGPIIQSICIECHVSGGQAQGSALTYLSSSQQNYLQTNYNTLVNYIKNGGSTNILAKPSGATGHGGGTRLPAGSSLYQDFEAFVSAVLAE